MAHTTARDSARPNSGEEVHPFAPASAPMLQLVLDRAGPAMRDGVQAGSDLAVFWLETAQAQAEHNLETLQRLAETREWREALSVQGDFLQRSMARISEAVLRQLQVAGSVTSSLLAATRTDLRDAA